MLARQLRSIVQEEEQTGTRNVEARRSYNRALRAAAAAAPALVGGARDVQDAHGNVWRIGGRGVGETCNISIGENQEVRIEQSVPILVRNVSFSSSTNLMRAAWDRDDKIVNVATGEEGGGEIVVAPRENAAVTLVRLVGAGPTLYIAKPNLLALSSTLSLGTRADWSVWSKFTSPTQIFSNLSGEGIAALCAYGSLIERKLGKGQAVGVELSALVAYDSTVRVKTVRRTRRWGVLGVRRAMGLYDGLSRYLFECRGPGSIFIQTRTMQ